MRTVERRQPPCCACSDTPILGAGLWSTKKKFRAHQAHRRPGHQDHGRGSSQPGSSRERDDAHTVLVDPAAASLSLARSASRRLSSRPPRTSAAARSIRRCRSERQAEPDGLEGVRDEVAGPTRDRGNGLRNRRDIIRRKLGPDLLVVVEGHDQLLGSTKRLDGAGYMRISADDAHGLPACPKQKRHRPPVLGGKKVAAIACLRRASPDSSG